MITILRVITLTVITSLAIAISAGLISQWLHPYLGPEQGFWQASNHILVSILIVFASIYLLAPSHNSFKLLKNIEYFIFSNSIFAKRKSFALGVMAACIILVSILALEHAASILRGPPLPGWEWLGSEAFKVIFIVMTIGLIIWAKNAAGPVLFVVQANHYVVSPSDPKSDIDNKHKCKNILVALSTVNSKLLSTMRTSGENNICSTVLPFTDIGINKQLEAVINDSPTSDPDHDHEAFHFITCHIKTTKMHFAWQQTLRAIEKHCSKNDGLWTVPNVIVATSTLPEGGSSNQYDCFEKLLQNLFAILQAENKKTDEENILTFSITEWAASQPDEFGTKPNVSFEDFTLVQKTIDDLVVQLQEKKESLCIDITGGQKPYAMAATASALNTNVILSYMETKNIGSSPHPKNSTHHQSTRAIIYQKLKVDTIDPDKSSVGH